MADVVGAFNEGRAAGLQVRAHQQALEESQLQQMVLKHKLEEAKVALNQQKVTDALRLHEIKRAQAQLQFDAAQGQPAASFATPIPQAPTGALAPGVTLPQSQTPETVPTGPAPVAFPGLPPELGGGAGYARTPQTLEQLLVSNQRAQLEKARWEKYNPGDVVPGFNDGQPPAGGRAPIPIPAGGLWDPSTKTTVVPGRPEPPEPTVTIRTIEGGQPVVKVLPRSQAMGQTFPDRPPASRPATGDAGDATDIADAIIRGEQPPSTQGLYRFAAPVRAALAKKGYDLTKANLDWTATQKHLATLNGAQQTRLRQAIGTATESLGVIEDLAKQWDGGKFPLLNKASLALAKNGVLGPAAQQIATNLDAQITDVVSELANAYMGGNSPTDHALALAQKNLSANWTKDQLLSAVKLARTNLQIRQNSIQNATAILSTGAAGTPPAAPAAPVLPQATLPNGQIQVTAPDGSQHLFATQAAADRFKALVAGAQ